MLKTYRELERKGIAEGRPGLGTFIVADPPIPGPRELAGLRQPLGRWLRDADGAGLDERTMAALFEMSLHDFHVATAGGGRMNMAAETTALGKRYRRT